jgi:hypothetical protein
LTTDEQSATVPPTSPHEEAARKYYEVLLAASTVEDIANAKLPVFRGYYGEQFKLTGLPQSQYHPAKVLLEFNGVIEVVERSWRGTPGMVVLYPLGEMLSSPPKGAKDLQVTESFARLQDRVKRLEELVGDVHLPSVLEEIAHRLDRREGSNG